MNDEDLQELIDKAMANRLTPEEEQHWNALLAERPELEEEVALADAFRSLPSPPVVSSNFTALVLQKIASSQITPRPTSWHDWLRWPSFSRLAATAVVIFGVSLAVVQNRKAEQAQKAAQVFAASVQQVTPALEVPPEDVVTLFTDFEAIRRLPASASDVDYKLLAALQK